ncbi:MAG TPA: PAC2 family protein [Acidimicrobiales bacterium]|jgi:predicted ATP-grasp superfamily ATP-dependent carboligase|nr:PAC2 family protein [Acidimicrobiales bacterium]
MDLVRWEREAGLRRPLMVVAFEGWNDAGDASSLALDYLARAWNAERFAVIEAEEFYDFTVTRPHVRMTDDGRRRIDWPDIELLAAHVPGSAHDLVLIRGVEPQLRWRTFSRAVLEVAQTVKAELAVILGALLADVPHTRPVRVSGTTDDQELAHRLGLGTPSYEGPTGIVGVLHDALRSGGIPTASFWAAVPHYVHQLPSPKAALALVEKSAALLGAPVDPNELRAAARDYEREVDERIADDEDAAAYVAQLEETSETDWPEASELPDGLRIGSIDELAAEVERFLRDHPQGQ